ncbi:hypothetical protein [Rhizobium phage RHph_X2_24]|nr:hypothetical protein [Rhizobium phage RHph_X2_24]
MRVPTVVIETDNGPVTINKSDFDASKHKLVEGEAVQVAAETEPPAGEPQPQQPQTEPAQLLVSKKGKKFIVVDAAGNVIEREGIDADGYGSEADAWGAIMALPQPQA